jgi:hypothetical protein
MSDNSGSHPGRDRAAVKELVDQVLVAAREALEREAEGWRQLAEAATTDVWRAQFELRVTDAMRDAAEVDALRHSLLTQLGVRQEGAEAER